VHSAVPGTRLCGYEQVRLFAECGIKLGKLMPIAEHDSKIDAGP